MRPFSLLVKPVGSACNLACPYCFYRGHGSSARMDEGLLDRLLSSYRALPIATHAVAFQGGEPLLAGEAFFRRAAARGEGVSFSVQTNATLVTEALADFFAREDWLVGVSPHWDARGCGASASLGREGYRRLRAAGVRTNILQLVTAGNVGEPERLYRHLRDDLGATYHQYIECTSPSAFAVTGAAWGEFLCRLFDVWRGDGDVRRVSVRLFDSIVAQLRFGVPTVCNFARDCRNYLVVDANGDVYPCDFHVLPGHRLGNVLAQSWEELVASPAYRAFGERKLAFPDCPRNRGALDEGWRKFFAHATSYFRELVV